MMASNGNNALQLDNKNNNNNNNNAGTGPCQALGVRHEFAPYLECIVQSIRSDNADTVLRYLTNMNILFSVKYRSLSDRLMKFNVTPTLLSLLSGTRYPDIQIQAARAIASLVTGVEDRMKCPLAEEVCPTLISHLELTENNPAGPETARALARIAASNAQISCMIVDKGVLLLLARLINLDISDEFLEALSLCLYNLLYHWNPDRLPPSGVGFLVPVIHRILTHQSDSIVFYGCSLLSLVTTQRNVISNRQLVDASVVARLVRILMSATEYDLLIAALSAIGNVALANNQEALAPIDRHALDALKRLLTNPDISDNVLWTLASLTHCLSRSLCQAMFDSQILLGLTQFVESDDTDVQNTATRIVVNMTRQQRSQRIRSSQPVLSPAHR